MTTESVLTEKDRQKLKADIAITKGEGLFWEIVDAVEQAVLQSPEVQRLRNIEKVALSVLSYTQAKHRPPVREAIPCGETTAVRVHALADLHDALHPESPAKTAAMEKQP